jgi:uncharacterized protein (DUF1330 family)
MNVENAVSATPEQAKAIFGAPEDGPLVMVNLIKFKDRATYENGEDVSGREAYARYGARMKKMVEAEGGRLIYSGDVKSLMLGVVDDLWDSVGLMEYPSRAVFQKIISSPAYREIEVHRHAGLAGQLNIETKKR